MVGKGTLQTECSKAKKMQRDKDERDGDSGSPVNGVEVKGGTLISKVLPG